MKMTGVGNGVVVPTVGMGMVVSRISNGVSVSGFIVGVIVSGIGDTVTMARQFAGRERMALLAAIGIYGVG